MPRVARFLGMLAPSPCTACALAAILVLAACERFDDAPSRVARSYWDAVLAHDGAAASALALTPAESRDAELAPPRALASISLGRILRDEDTALVETSAVFADGDQPVSFHTHLARQGGQWRVDVAETRRDLTRAALGASLEQVRESLARSADSLSEALQRSALEASEALRRALDELDRDLHPGKP